MFGKSKKKHKKIETTKKLLIVNYIMIIFIVLFTGIMTFKTDDLSALGILIPSAFAEVGTVTSFYINKAKCENLKKYGLKIDDLEGGI